MTYTLAMASNRLNDYFTNNYTWLEKSAISICGKINKHNLASDLISDTFIHLEKHYKKEMSDNEIKSIILNYMNYQIIWSKTKLKKDNIIKDNIVYQDYIQNKDIVDDEPSSDELMEKWLIEQKQTTDKINYIYIWLENAEPADKLLFDVVYTKGYNTSGKLAKYSELSRTTCYHLIKNLKTKIKEDYKQFQIKNN